VYCRLFPLPDRKQIMNGVVVQVSVSPGGIPKRPVSKAFISRSGIEGDEVAHPTIHGGPRQAVLLLSEEAIEELKEQGYPVYPGALGENLTTRGIDRRLLRCGQRLHVGDAILELTRPRRPCKALTVYGEDIQKAIFDEQVRAGNPVSLKWGLSGFYASVVQPGRVSEGCPIALLDQLV